MKKTTLFLFSIILTNFVLAQNVLIIPFDSKMFNNQESEQICKYSNISYDKSVSQITTSLDHHIYVALKDSLSVSSLLQTYTTDASTDLESVHDNAQYFLSENKNEQINTRGSNTNLDKQQIIAGEVVSVKNDNSNKLMNVKFHDPQIFSDLIQNYQAKYVVYLTEFELLGDYSDPYAVGEHSYLRTIKVHYVIYNAMGKFVDGDIAKTTFSAKVNDIDQICDLYLPVIAKQIAKRIP